MAFLGGIGGGGGTIGDGLIRIGAVTSGLRGQVRGAVNDIRSELNTGAKQIQAQGQNWNKAFGVIGAAAKIGMAGVAIGLATAIGASISFEKAWAGVRKTVDATPARLEKLRAEFRALAKEIPISVNELAGIGETAGALGVPTESILAFTKVVAELGSTTNVSSDQAATSLGQLSNVLKLTEKDYEKFGSTLVDLGNKGASTESQILDIASRAGAAGRLIGMSTPAILAWGSAVASLGIETEAGGSALQFFYLQASKVINEVSKKGPPSARALAEAQAKVAIATERLTKAEKAHGKSSLAAKSASLSLAKAQDALASMTHGTAIELETLAKTAGMTVPAFKSLYAKDASAALAAFITGLGKLPAGAQQGVLAIEKLNNIRVIRAMLGLANNAGELNRQLGVGSKAWADNTALASAAGKRYETTAAQLSILKNTLMDMFISVGDNALPIVKWLVRVFKEDIPKAAAFLSGVIQKVWSTSLQPAFLAMVGGLQTFGEGIAGIFDFGGGGTQGSAVETLLTGIGDAASQAARMIGAVATALGDLLKNPVVNALAKVGVIMAGISLAISGGAAVVGKLTGGMRSIARTLTFGKLGNGGQQATPLDQSAKALDTSAAELKGAAAALKGAAGAQKADALLGGTGFRGSGPMNMLPGSGAAMNVASQEAQIAKAAYGQTSAAARAYQRGLAQPLNAADRAAFQRGAYNSGAAMLKNRASDVVSGITGGVKSVGSMAKGALGLASRAFWPLIIADLGIEFLKAPLGDLIISNTKFKRAGAQMKEDFFGGLISLVQSWAMGSDAWVGHADTMTIGKSSFKTITLAKLGITSATFDKLEAPVGTIEHAQGVAESTGALTKGLGRKAGEDFLVWYMRIKDQLPEEVRKQVEGVIKAADIRPRMTKATPAEVAAMAAGRLKVGDILKQAVGEQVTGLEATTRDEYVTALTDALKGRGFTSGQIAGLSAGQLATIGAIVSKDASGQYGFITDFLTNTFLGTIDQKTKAQVTLSADAKARIAALSKGFGKNWETTLSAFTSNAFPKTKANNAIVAKLQKLLGNDWQDVLKETFRELRPARTGRGAPGALSKGIEGLKTGETRTEAAMRAFFQNIPVEVQNALNDFVTQTKTVDPAVQLKLRKKFGNDWLIAMKDGTGAITDKPVDKSVVDEMVRRFGPNWREALQGFGRLLFEKEGGADSAALKAALAAAISGQIAKLSPDDLAPAGAKPLSKTATAKTKADIKKVLFDPAVKAMLEAAASPDTAKSKKGFEDLGKALKNAIPDDSARARFIGPLVALQKAALTPNLDQLSGFLQVAIPKAADAIQSAASRFDVLTAAVMRFLNATGGAPPPPSGGGKRSPNAKGGQAQGIVFDTQGETSMTVGEAGREHVAVLRNFRTMRLPKLPAAQSLVHDIVGGLRSVGTAPMNALESAGGRGGGGVHVTADKLQLFSDGDRRSLDAQLAFLAPDGR